MSYVANSQAAFPYVDESTSLVLLAPSRNATVGTRKSNTSPRLWFELNHVGKFSCIRDSRAEQAADVSLDDLVALARQASDLVYGPLADRNNPPVDPWLENILMLSSRKDDGPLKSCVLLSLLVTLNNLESAIRSSIGSASSGKSPLLKDMLEEMNDDILANVCKILLLPSGLNLRNLVWHGFVGEHEALKPWLALVLAILQVMGFSPAYDELLPSSDSPLLRNAAYVSKRCRRQLDTILKEGTRIRGTMPPGMLSEERKSPEVSAIFSSGFIPSTHRSMLWLALDLIQLKCPSLASMLLVVVLEHSLRLLWCRANHRPGSAIAKPCCYYVTLDGHGQRNKHDVILHYDCDSPSGGDSTERNKLCDILGGSTMSLLTDLFISGCGGPNLRAAMSHGMDDGACANELSRLRAATNIHGENEASVYSPSFDSVDALLVVINVVSSHDQGGKKETQHVPLFSFAATTADSIYDLCDAVTELKGLLADYRTESILPDIDLDNLCRKYETLLNIQSYRQRSHWSVDDLFEEKVVNEILLPLTAARTLLCDTMLALREFLDNAKCMNLEKPRMKTKVFHLSRLACFAMFVALCHMKCPSDSHGRKIVERTRMVVSTMSTFIFKDDRRSFKALEIFAKAKITKPIISKATEK